MTDDRPTVLSVVNFPLPAGDYRLAYAVRRSDRLRVMFAMPVPSNVLDPREVVVLPFGEGVTWRDVLTFVRLGATLFRLRHTLAFVHFYSTKLILLGPVLARLVGIRSVITVTGFGRIFVEDSFRYRLARVPYRTLFRLAVGLSDRVLFQNRTDMQTTGDWLPDRVATFRYVGSGTADSEAEPVDRPARARPQILHVARLLPSKGIADFLEVAATLRSEADFVLVGGPSERYPELLRRVRDAAEHGVITYVGRLDSERLVEIYRASSILFFPSYGEGMARVMLEAGMHGLCPVGYDIPANRDVVLAGAGFLVPFRDISAATELLRRLLRDSELLQSNAQSYSAHIRKHFSIEAFAERLDDALCDLLQRPVRAKAQGAA